MSGIERLLLRGLLYLILASGTLVFLETGGQADQVVPSSAFVALTVAAAGLACSARP